MRKLLVVLFLAGCSVEGDAPPGDTEVVAEPEVDRDAVRACLAERWVRQRCSGCHLEGSHLDLRFDALRTLRAASRESQPDEKIVVPGDPDTSLLVRKVEAKVGLVTLEEGEGDPMPIDTEISLDDAQLIRDWVAAGAALPTGC